MLSNLQNIRLWAIIPYMTSQELCLTCKPSGMCLFEKAAKSIAQKVPPLDLQTPIEPNGKPTEEAADAHRQISLLRESARSWNCPRVNSINPDYPGKNNL